MQKEVAVPFNQAGHERGTAKHDLCGPGWRRNLGAHFRDARAEDEYRPALVELLTVVDTVWAQHHGLLRLERR